MRTVMFSPGFAGLTTAVVLTIAAPGCVGNVETGGTGGSAQSVSASTSGQGVGGDCGDTESTTVGVGEAVAVGVGVGGYGTSVASTSGPGGYGTASVSTVSASSVSVGVGGSGGAGGVCDTPPPSGPVQFCGGAVSGSSGGGTSCTTLACDGGGNTWDQTCDETGFCICSFNLQEVCSCQLAAPDEACTGVGCCPAPWMMGFP